jgi:large subunit ribosomal protein L19e
MKLKKKKELARKTLKCGKGRVIFLKPRLEEIKEAITKEDVRDLQKDGAIVIKNQKGRRKVKVKKRKKGIGKIKKKVNVRKRDYVILTRKLRKYVAELKKQKKISKEEAKELREKIRNKMFRSQAHLKEQIKTKWE